MFGQQGDAPRTPDKDLSGMLQDMDESGVAKVIVQSSMYYPGTQDQLAQRHREVANVMNVAAERIAGTATVLPPTQGPATYWDLLQNPRLLEDAVQEYGFRGVHLLPAPWGTPPNDRWYYPLYSKCVELGLTVFTYIGMPGPLWPMYPNFPLHLDDVCLAFPDLTVVGHHIGDPWVQMMTHLAARHENLYILTSAWSPKRYPPELLEFIADGWHGTRGADKVIFGTDYPLLNLQKAVSDARHLDLDTDVLEKVMYGNAERLFW